MRVEIPEFKRCCFCLPLRYSLLVIGYFRLLFSGLLFTVIACGLSRRHSYSPDIMAYIVLVVIVVDMSMLVLFIASAHLKKVRLMSIFYKFNIVENGLVSVMFILKAIFFLYQYCYYTFIYNSHRRHEDYTMIIIYGVYEICFALGFIFLSVYHTLLVRSELLKLERENDASFQFVNNAAEAECSMSITTIIPDELTDKQNGGII